MREVPDVPYKFAYRDHTKKRATEMIGDLKRRATVELSKRANNSPCCRLSKSPTDEFTRYDIPWWVHASGQYEKRWQITWLCCDHFVESSSKLVWHWAVCPGGDVVYNTCSRFPTSSTNKVIVRGKNVPKTQNRLGINCFGQKKKNPRLASPM